MIILYLLTKQSLLILSTWDKFLCCTLLRQLISLFDRHRNIKNHPQKSLRALYHIFGFSSDFLFEERHRIIPNMHYKFVFAHFIFILRCWCKVQSTLLCKSFLHFYQNIQKLLLRQPWQNFFFSSLTFPILNEMRLMQAGEKDLESFALLHVQGQKLDLSSPSPL